MALTPSNVARQVEYYFSTVAIHFFNQSVLVDTYTTRILLRKLKNIHKSQHSQHSLFHAVVAVAAASCSRFAVPSDNRDSGDVLELFRIFHVRYHAFFKPPA